MSITVTRKAATPPPPPPRVKNKKITSTAILATIKPVNINPVNKGTNAVLVDHHYQVKKETMMHRLVRDIANANVDSITIDEAEFSRYFSKKAAEYVSKHCEELGVRIISENPVLDEVPATAKAPVPTVVREVEKPIESSASENQDLDMALKKLTNDILANNLKMVELSKYNISYSDITSDKAADLMSLCYKNKILLM